MITLGDYLLVSGILFSIGFAGVMLRRNLIIILMSLELMLNAANLSLVAFSRFRVDPSVLPNYSAQVFVFFIITVAAAEVAVGLAILVAHFKFQFCRGFCSEEDIRVIAEPEILRSLADIARNLRLTLSLVAAEERDNPVFNTKP